MNKIIQIEGLRGYLALWVMIDHLIASCGYPVNKLFGITRIIRSGWYAVDLFIIISGFVIFYLLDTKRESYFEFIFRRFFRLFPLFIVLFFISIPISYLNLDNIESFSLIYTSSEFGHSSLAIKEWFNHLTENILLHITMIHGVIPQSIIPYAPGAFLPTAWSISLEWQFYLIAPFAFNLIQSSKKYKSILFYLLILIFFIFQNKIYDVQYGAFLPMHIEYFYIGCLSYFIYKKTILNLEINNTFIPFTLLAYIVFRYSSNLDILPICIWLSFFGLLINQKNAVIKLSILNLFIFLLNNKYSQHISKISYSIYLSHLPIITVIQWVLLKYFSSLSRKEHLATLTLITIPVVLIISHFLYTHIETKGIDLSKKALKKITSKNIF